MGVRGRTIPWPYILRVLDLSFVPEMGELGWTPFRFFLVALNPPRLVRGQEVKSAACPTVCLHSIALGST